ncbi:hypothetical protein A4H97_04865 [Niastella yeongjuensis]|uniref:DUF3592 domain-containing protein n=1 Tax=Niastella yeongjuensis TaxID=354355 RepID=A0A1V9EL37_9BACT|nr:hypothetical protein [Niastella yeongjuensis]OQP46858.1 hypothetical protein A4H97_04865 [Niastella yeongjuensis]SEN57423.1 hypothetical protein SAMN05660816_00996 [Niastella yeongjuensis]
MLKGLITTARNFYSWFWSIIIALLLGYLTWGSWRLYNNEKELQQFIKEGQPVKVQVTATDRQNHVWYDQFSNKVYITFNYNNQSYSTRYIQDSGWVYVGDKLTLLYHPQYNAFRQATKQINFKDRTNRSLLLDFSFVSMWNDERKWLLLTLILGTAFVLLTMGLISSIVHIPLLAHVGRLIVTAGVLSFALYFTYNGWQYHSYFNKIKNEGQQKTVTIISTEYQRHSKRSDAWWVTYEAWVQFDKEQRMIPIEEDDYDKLKANDQLPVFYNPSLNDMMPVNYTGDNMNIWVAVFFWAFAAFFVWQNYLKRKENR